MIAMITICNSCGNVSDAQNRRIQKNRDFTQDVLLDVPDKSEEPIEESNIEKTPKEDDKKAQLC